MSASSHNHPDGGGHPYQVPPEPKRWPAIGLAVGVHVLLLAFLVIGINWQNHEPVAIEAEVWDVSTQTAAPPPPAPAPAPEPEPTPPAPAPKAVEPPPPAEQPQVVQPKAPDIALEREKRKEALKQKQRQEEQERERDEQAAQQQRADEKKARALAEKKEEQAAQKTAEEAQAKKDAQAKELAKQEEAEKKKKADKDKADKLAKQKAKAEDAKLAKLHEDDMKRMLAAAGNGSSGTAEKSSAPHRDSGYIAAITAAVKSHAAYGGDDPGNPVVTFHVEQLPTGDIMSVRMTKSSGIPAFDEAIERAIKGASPLPKKKDGTVERSLEINFKMKDMQ